MSSSISDDESFPFEQAIIKKYKKGIEDAKDMKNKIQKRKTFYKDLFSRYISSEINKAFKNKKFCLGKEDFDIFWLSDDKRFYDFEFIDKDGCLLSQSHLTTEDFPEDERLDTIITYLNNIGVKTTYSRCIGLFSKRRYYSVKLKCIKLSD